jgi:hypothetical protein
MARLAARRIPEGLCASVEHVTREGEIIVFRRGKRGKPLAALVPVGSDEALEALEDEIDARAARNALHERSIPWDQVKKDLGL